MSITFDGHILSNGEFARKNLAKLLEIHTGWSKKKLLFDLE